jgi:hypothetical protein
VNDPGGLSRWNGDQLEHRSTGVRADDEQPLLAGVLELDVPDRVTPRMRDIGIADAMFPRAGPNPRASRLT